MEYQEFLKRTQQASELMRSSHLQETIDALYLLVLSDISDVDKVVICRDLAAVYDRMGKTEDAISWYDKAIDLEQNCCRFDVYEKKAQYLASLGRSQNAIAIYESLIKQPYVSEADKERMRKIVQSLLGQSMREWK
jgi:tetratricopeptide (TPR) repeat protein